MITEFISLLFVFLCIASFVRRRCTAFVWIPILAIWFYISSDSFLRVVLKLCILTASLIYIDVAMVLLRREAYVKIPGVLWYSLDRFLNNARIFMLSLFLALYLDAVLATIIRGYAILRFLLIILLLTLLMKYLPKLSMDKVALGLLALTLILVMIAEPIMLHEMDTLRSSIEIVGVILDAFG